MNPSRKFVINFIILVYHEEAIKAIDNMEEEVVKGTLSGAKLVKETKALFLSDLPKFSVFKRSFQFGVG